MADHGWFQVNYYVGTMLAESGNLRVDDAGIVFTPTGLIERIMGAKDVVIRMEEIVAFQYTGGLSRTVRVKTLEKIHKFEGSATSGFGEILLKKIPHKAVQRPSEVKPLHPFIGPKYSCDQCTEVLQPGLSFCTRCGATPRGLCDKCHRLVDTDWNCCGFCGSRLDAATEPIRKQRVV